MTGSSDAKERIAALARDDLEREIRKLIDGHPILSRLPVRDRYAAAYCGTIHLLLAIRSSAAASALGAG